MGFFYTTDGTIDNTAYVLYVIILVVIPLIMITFQWYILPYRNDDFVKYRFPVTTSLVTWCMYFALLEGELTNNVVNNYPSLCHYTNGRLRFQEITVILSAIIIIGNGTKLTYLSFKQYWSSQPNVRGLSTRVLCTERVIKWLISKRWFVLSFQIILFNLYFWLRLLQGSDCYAVDNTASVFIAITVTIIVILGYLIKVYGIKDSFQIRHELLQNIVFIAIMLLIAFIVVIIVGNITAKAGITAIYYLILYVGVIGNIYYRPARYIWSKKRQTSNSNPIKTINKHQVINVSRAEPSSLIDVNRSTTVQTIIPASITFDFMMETIILKNAFRKHLISEFSCENLMFVEDATAFRNATENTNLTVEEQAEHIYRTYIIDGAEMQVNISSTQRENIQKVFKTHSKITTELFTEAVVEIIKLLSNDSWLRFVTSKGAISACQEIVIPQQEVKTEEAKRSNGWVTPNNQLTTPTRAINVSIITSSS